MLSVAKLKEVLPRLRAEVDSESESPVRRAYEDGSYTALALRIQSV